MDELTLEEQLLVDACQNDGMIALDSLGPHPGPWAALEDMIDEDLFEPVTDANGEMVGWRLTEDGEAYVEDQGLVG